jgi:hypothetical protein
MKDPWQNVQLKNTTAFWRLRTTSKVDCITGKEEREKVFQIDIYLAHKQNPTFAMAIA